MSFDQVLLRRKVKHHSFYCLEKIHLRIPFSLLQLNNKKEADLDFSLISFHLGSNENRKEYFFYKSLMLASLAGTCTSEAPFR